MHPERRPRGVKAFAIGSSRRGRDRAGNANTTYPHEQIFEAFSHYLREERGVTTRSIVHHLPFVRLFLREVYAGCAGDLGRIGQADVTRYIERHARDQSASSGKAMCWALRSSPPQLSAEREDKLCRVAYPYISMDNGENRCRSA